MHKVVDIWRKRVQTQIAAAHRLSAPIIINALPYEANMAAQCSLYATKGTTFTVDIPLDARPFQAAMPQGEASGTN